MTGLKRSVRASLIWNRLIRDRLEASVDQGRAEHTARSYAANLEDFRH